MRIYTDGACVPNPGTGGWGFVAIDGNGVLYEATGTENDATSNRMEMIASSRPWNGYRQEMSRGPVGRRSNNT